MTLLQIRLANLIACGQAIIKPRHSIFFTPFEEQAIEIRPMVPSRCALKAKFNARAESESMRSEFRLRVMARGCTTEARFVRFGRKATKHVRTVFDRFWL